MPDAPTAPSIPVIMNPVARSAQAGFRLDEIRRLSPRIDLRLTTGAGDARTFAAALARQGAPVIVASGGDGTVNEVLNGIADAGAAATTALGILPAGTMNVFAAELGLPQTRLDECWQAIERMRTRRIDLWRVNDTRFIQLAGAGIDAAVIEITTWERKKKLGPLSYVLSGLEILRRPATMLQISAEGQAPLEGTALLIGNGQRYGGPFRLFPRATPVDGLLDVVVLRSHGWSTVARLGLALATGRYGAGDLTYFQTPRLTVNADTPVPYQADGELAGTASTITFQADGHLNVCA